MYNKKKHIYIKSQIIEKLITFEELIIYNYIGAPKITLNAYNGPRGKPNVNNILYVQEVVTLQKKY